MGFRSIEDMISAALAMVLGDPVSLSNKSGLRGTPPVLLALADHRRCVCAPRLRLRPHCSPQARFAGGDDVDYDRLVFAVPWHFVLLPARINRIEPPRHAACVTKAARPKPLADSMGYASCRTGFQRFRRRRRTSRISSSSAKRSRGNLSAKATRSNRSRMAIRLILAMPRAIEAAKQSVGLSMYIFTDDRTGKRFAEALGRAVARGVEVRVLIDDVGARYLYSWHSISGPLQRAGVPTARFLPTFWPRSFAYANLRNHRKLMIVDGRLGFTGGMNITDECWLSFQPSYTIRDMQFRIEGPGRLPNAGSLRRGLDVHDAGESLDGDRWFPTLEPRGKMLACGVPAVLVKISVLRLALLGRFSAARTRVVIVTPFFLPDADLISALNITALRGVQVDILLPQDNDLLLVRWAETAQFAQMLEYGCRIWIVPGPFKHTKLMLVDGVWTMLGSANWDARSLRLNFEFNIECYDLAVAASLERSLEMSFAQAERLTLVNLNDRSFLAKLRDGVARLLMPYL